MSAAVPRPLTLAAFLAWEASLGLTVHERQTAGKRWTVTSVMSDDLLSLPEIGIEIPTAELYEGIEFPTSDIAAMPAE
jgi:hypothetical protein